MNFKSLASQTVLASSILSGLFAAPAFADIQEIECVIGDQHNRNRISVEAEILEGAQIPSQRAITFKNHRVSALLQLGDRHYPEKSLTLRVDKLNAISHNVDAGSRAELTGEDFFFQCWIQ